MCTDCFNNCNGELVSDRCVKYTGPDIPFLGINTGDSLSLVEAAIIAKLQTAVSGSGIDLTSVNIDCPFLLNILGTQDKNLRNLIQMLVIASCTLRELITELSAIVNAPFSIDTSCLSGLPANPTRDQVLQTTVLKLCAVAADVLLIKSDYVKASQLNSLIYAYLLSLGLISGGGGGVAQQNAKMVPMVAYEYYGSLSNFDSSGRGLLSAGFDKVYLCNGANGTPDKRGRVAVGAVRSVPGGALDPEVDPALPSNPGTNLAVRDKIGKYYVQLTSSEMPSHSHGVTDPGHKHLTASGWALYSDWDGAGSSLSNSGHDAVDFDTKTNDGLINSVTGISIQATGGNQAHLNIQPSIAALYIMYIP